MKVTDYVAATIGRLPKGYVFTHLDFTREGNRTDAVIKALNRMAASGKIVRLSKGKFYKPEITPFGALRPSQQQIVKDLLEKDGKITGYLTGYSIFNDLGLTTQLSYLIQIGSNNVRPTFRRAQYTIAFIRQKNIITKENIPLLQLLDAIRYIKKIPDTTIASAIKRLLSIVRDLSEKDIQKSVRLALKYPPATRALLGALLDEAGRHAMTEPLKKSLNPVTFYTFTGAVKIISTTEKWNIK